MIAVSGFAHKLSTEGLMTKRRLTALAAAIGLAMLISSNAFANSLPVRNSAVGTWKLDLSKSRFGNMTAPKFEQMVITTDDVDYLKWNLKGVMPDGKTFVEFYDGPIDGKDHKIALINGSSVAAYSRTAAGVQWITKDKNGSVIESGAGVLSPDGKTLTLKGTMTTPSGKGNFTAVYNRVQ